MPKSHMIGEQCNNYAPSNNLCTKHLSSDIKQQEVLKCYDFQHGIIDDEKDVVFITKLTLFELINSTYDGFVDLSIFFFSISKR